MDNMRRVMYFMNPRAWKHFQVLTQIKSMNRNLAEYVSVSTTMHLGNLALGQITQNLQSQNMSCVLSQRLQPS